MKSLKLALGLAVLPLAAAAPDAVTVDPGLYKVLIDNPSVRVLKISYAAGAKSPMHSHPDAMLVSLGNSKARFTLPDGKTQDSVIGKDTAMYTPATTHAPANIGTTPVDAVLVEFRAKEPGTATLPT
jgi:quercetin dioxygenase-like cupin family protein